MRVLYCHDNIYQKCEGGIVYSPGQFPYSYWAPYLEAFDELTIAGRGVGIDTEINKLNISSGERVNFELFPNINSLTGRLTYATKVNKQLEQVVANADAVIIRAVSDLGWLAYHHAKRMNKPLAMEMAACGWDSTWNHGNKLGKIYAPIRHIRDRIITANADFVLYVSQDFLQRRYPTNGVTAKASNVRIDKPDEEMIKKHLQSLQKKSLSLKEPYIIGLIGNLDNKIKGVKDTINALKTVEEQKPGSFLFKHLGPGNPKPYIQQAKDLNISHCIQFDGMRQTGDAVLEWLKELDIYLQPSYQEGVPRATIEAMSMATPVIASTAGGIPELIKPEWLIKPGDTKTLAKLIIKMLENPVTQYETGLENFNKSMNYTSDKLIPKRQEFWSAFAELARKKQNKNTDIKSLNPQIT